MESLFEDVRFGVRTLLKNPGFTIVAILTLALGIGANVAIFSVVYAVLLRPLPFPQSERLVTLGPNEDGEVGSFAPAEFVALQREQKVFDAVTAIRGGNFNLSTGERPERVFGAVASKNFFRLVGVNPMIGRGFAPEDAPGEDQSVVVLSNALWTTQFGDNSEILGRTALLNGEPRTVIGVMPPEFDFPDNAQLWVPSRFAVPAHPIRPNEDPSARFDTHYFDTYGRLKAAVTPAQAEGPMSALFGQIAKQNPDAEQNAKVRVQSLQEYEVGDVRPALLLLLGAVALVLLIACANIANLLLVRGSARHRELAIRRALGASAARVARQLLTESVLLSAAGGVAGIVVASWFFRPLVALVPADLRNMVHLQLNAPLLMFAFVLSILAGVFFGLVPALQSGHGDLNETLKAASARGTMTAGRQRMQKALVLTEIAMALILLCGAGLLMRSFVRLNSVPTGFNPSGVMAMQLSLIQTGYEQPTKRTQFVDQILENIQALPGVQSAAIVTRLPLNPGSSSRSVTVEGHTYPSDSPAQQESPDYTVATPGYFHTLNIPFFEGRDFQKTDTADMPSVAIINRAMARVYWPGEDPLGKRFEIEGTTQWLQIVGIVGDIHQHKLGDPPKPMFYAAYAQDPWTFFTIAVRTSANPSQIAPSLVNAVQNVDHNLPVFNLRRFDEILAASVSQPRFQMILLSLFGGLALTLAVIGIYGVMSYTVAQRTNEIGIRMALGAEPRHVLAQILSQGARLAGCGTIAGLVASYFVTRFMKSMLFAVSPLDPGTYAAVTALLMAVTLLACYVPARRAMRVDPMIALRYE
ncbi:MAG: ABC transporter permease [Candidatus Acidiferrales bacterium]